MKVYIDPTETESKAISRTMQALQDYAPASVSFVVNPRDSDLVIINVVGRLEHTLRRVKTFDKPYAVVQYALMSTKNPKSEDWLPLWQPAKLVWSYYDLGDSPSFNFYRSPLGVEKVFKKSLCAKKYIIASSGPGYLIESVRECILAAENVGERVFHVGPVVTNRKNVDFSNGLSDADLAKNYSACSYVSGLRRLEGFELPVIEGLVCGARPIVFDKPHYRDWFNDFAIFIPETYRGDIILSLTKIFKGSYKPVTETEIAEARKRFDWEKIIAGFWQRCLS